MFDYLTSAFGFTVICLPFIMFIALGFPPVLLHMTRPKDEQGQPKKRNPVTSVLAFTRFYFISLIGLTTVTIIVLFIFIVVGGADNALNFASQNLPVSEDAVEEALEPALTVEAER